MTEFNIATNCKDCYFADYKNNTQDGCSLNRLEKYKKAGIDIIEGKDDDKEFYVVSEKFCVYYRTGEDIQKLNLNNREEASTYIESKLQAPYHLIVMCREDDTEADLEKCILSAINQKIKPKVFTIINKFNQNIPSTTMMEMVRPHSFDYWRVQNATNEEFEWDRDLIDLSYDSTKKHKYLFYAVFETLQGVPPTFSEEIHDAMYEDMQAFSCLVPNTNNNGLVVLSIAQEKYSGSSFGIKIEEKIKFYKDDIHTIHNVENLCPSLKI